MQDKHKPHLERVIIFLAHITNFAPIANEIIIDMGDETSDEFILTIHQLIDVAITRLNSVKITLHKIMLKRKKTKTNVTFGKQK